MKTQATTRGESGFNRTELLVVIVVIGVAALLYGLLIAGFNAAKAKAQQMMCVDNLEKVSAGFQVWKADNNGKYPMQVALTNSETMQLFSNGNACFFWRSISGNYAINWTNCLSTNLQFTDDDLDITTNSRDFFFPRYLVCPADPRRNYATNFIDFNDGNISYFFNLDADGRVPQSFLVGDDNFAVDGKTVQAGILNLSTNSLIAWTDERHRRGGNIALADGAVSYVRMGDFNEARSSAIPINNLTLAGLIKTGSATNRLVIP